jgi:glycosyltransferase involved in cell wall biosynthesis
VVTNAGALPEVVGDAGVQVASNRPEEVAEGVRRALELEDDARARARERVLTEFPVEARRRRLWATVEALAAR